MPARVKPIELSGEDRELLEGVVSRGTSQAREYVRAKVLLLKAESWANEAIADKLDVSVPTVRLCLAKFAEGGAAAALADAPGRGRPTEISEADRLWAVSVACSRPKDLGLPAELWYPALLTRHIRSVAGAEGHPRMATVSETKVREIMRDAKVRPFKVTYYCERRDPDFDARRHDVLVVYKQLSLCFDEAGEVWADCVDAEGRVVHTVSYDEKPGIQALATTGEDLPPSPGGDGRGRPSTVRRDHEYVRLGTRTLLAGIDLLTGVAHPLVRPSHKSSDFVDFLRRLDAYYPKGGVVRLMLDNHSAHVSAETQRYLNTVPGRFCFVFTPTHGSWLNLVEAFFGRMSRQMLRGIRVRSVEELEDRIYRWFDEFNAEPAPYRWTWGLDGVDMDEEDPAEIPYEVVNAKAARPEDRGKRAPKPPRRGRRKRAAAAAQA